MNDVITQAPSMGTVILLGLAIVFAGLICIVFLCKLMSYILTLIPEKTDAPSAKPAAPKAGLKIPKIQKPAAAPTAAPAAPVAPAAPAAPATPAARPDRGAIIAAISAAIAEENGTDVSAIRILSIKRV